MRATVNGNTRGLGAESDNLCIGLEVSQSGIRTCSSCGASLSNLRLDRRSRMRRESHVWFCEGAGVKFPRATRLFVGLAPTATLRFPFALSATLYFPALIFFWQPARVPSA